MALIKEGPLVSSIRGKLGGLTFSANKTGPYVRTAAGIPNQQTEAQTTFRGKLQEWATSWNSLTFSQRAAWDAFALLPANERTNSVGTTYFFSGFNAFVQINQHKFLVGQNPAVFPPVDAFPLALNITAFTFVSGGPANMIFSPTPAASRFVVVFAAVFRSEGLLNATTNFQVVHVSSLSPMSPIDLEPGITEVFGTVRTESKVFLRGFLQKGQGHRGPVETATTVVV